MKKMFQREKRISLILICAAACIFLSACASQPAARVALQTGQEAEFLDESRFLTVVEDEPDTVDFQCTTIHYTIALNVFDRLVENRLNPDGSVEIAPSLAESWEVSGDGKSYTFHLRENVRFSNGSPLTSSDVLYTLTRLLTHPDSCNRDIAMEILGAPQLAAGEADTLAGFEALSDRDFAITLTQPFEAFLACLSMPGASILDEETTRAAGGRFGLDPEATVGTGHYLFKKWDRGKGILLTANPDCWAGLPKNDGIDARFIMDAEAERAMYENGELDILELDNLGPSAEYFIHGDIYQDRLYETQEVGISYIALNESIEPLNDARVRRAMQLALDRQTLLDAVYSGRGQVENGVMPHGLKGFNPDAEAIPFDPEEAKSLLREAGYPEGFDLRISVKASSIQKEKQLMTLAASMWNRVGIRAEVELLHEDDFFSRRKSGSLACYTATWAADFDDPDNFFSTFFGSRENAVFRSLCYQNEQAMERVRKARAMTDRDARTREYQALEEIIVRQDAAWIPLFSRLHYYVAGERVSAFEVSWNGWVSPRYSDIAIGGI
ncbi:MAG: ABC transporter substrate-binding protein [Clostridia bacterium]|nr:ABC transporter substrate-binding protein [Clostridia bacterium]MBR0406986.1 ABC transporter substrate-binding protein [Clostridia bacterium]